MLHKYRILNDHISYVYKIRKCTFLSNNTLINETKQLVGGEWSAGGINIETGSIAQVEPDQAAHPSSLGDSLVPSSRKGNVTSGADSQESS